jgi:hypothetical protein
MKNGFRVKAYKHPRLKFVVRGKVAGKWQRKYFETKGELALQLGHTHTHLIFQHYRQIVKPADAERYWKITPIGAS